MPSLSCHLLGEHSAPLGRQAVPSPSVLWGSLLLSLCLLAGTTAAAETPDDEAVARGIHLFRIGEFDQSIAVLEGALQRHGDTKTAAKIHLYCGLSHTVIGNRDRARSHFVRALTLDPTLALDPRSYKPLLIQEFSKVRASLRGELEVTSNIADATVHVDGREVGRVPQTLRLPIGSHEVEVFDASGAKRIYQGMRVLRPDQKIVVEANGDLPVKASPPRTRFWRRSRLWTWVAAGGAALFAIGGAAFWASAEAEYNDLEAGYQQAYDEGRADYIADSKSSIVAKDKVGGAMFIAAGALLVTSTVLLFVEGRSDRRRPSVSFGLAPSGLGLSVALRR